MRWHLALFTEAAFVFVLCPHAVAEGSVYAEFLDRREPPAYRELTPQQRSEFELGVAVFNTQWVLAGTPRAERRDGLGPVFNAASCDACHNNGGRGQAPERSGAVSTGLVIQLSDGGKATARYGHVLNTSAIDGFAAEGKVRVIYEERSGRYPDGQAWTLRVPHYELYELRDGALDASTVIKPRIAPALFGVGLLDHVPRMLHRGAATVPNGRFGWQADSSSLSDQTASALSREMGLSSSLIPRADCGQAQACLAADSSGAPEVSEEFMHALLALQRSLAVPKPKAEPATVPAGEALFESTGCALCHRPQMPVEGIKSMTSIPAYTDLQLHDMGADLADRTSLGEPVNSLWRTAPLWGLGHVDRRGEVNSLLHDGRARSIEEAILWHGGEAAAVRDRFQTMSSAQRATLLAWLTLH